ncbi:MAG: CoA transferase [Dehalococcoidia bacterium]|jgi:crotonobetainyl-CoA:carnitine CoA-transferase CaiB-like acyl-CoA transferase|nr:CoA transferase [Dehalococcoidia bacterium]
MSAPLDGLSVLDISEGIPGPFCAKLLGDLGADVVKVERPGRGDASRSLPSDGAVPATNGSSPDGTPGGGGHPGATSGTFFFMNTSKRGVTLDLDGERGRELLGGLLPQYDIVVAGETERELAARGLGYGQLQRWHPSVILTTISGFGSEGPHAGYRWSHLIACAVGGWSNNCGVPDREPLQAGGAIAESLAGAFAAAGTLIAALGRTAHGGGDHVDVSAQEAAIAAALFPSLVYEYRGVVGERNSHVGPGPSFILPTTDGHVGVNVLTGPQWDLLCQFFGRPDMVDDPRFQPPQRHLHANDARDAFTAAMADRTADDVFHDGQTWRVPFGLVLGMEAVSDFLPHQEREFLVELDSPSGGAVTVPGVPFQSTAPAPTVGPPPEIGEHNEHVFRELLGLSEGEIAELSREGVI